MSQSHSDILKQILARKAEEILERQNEVSFREQLRRAECQDTPRGFLDQIKNRILQGQPAVIAEIKKASPSKGVLCSDFQPAAIAKSYEASGAACLSVLTDRDFFQGSEIALMEARAATRIPVIRKDFIIDAYQVAEARAIGADCILLIVAALDDESLRRLSTQAADLGMDVLVEVHDFQELERALAIDLPLIGINNRNLRTFEVRLETTLELLSHIPENRIVVTESGILSPEDVSRMRGHGVHAFLVGESFMRCSDPGARLFEFFFSKHDR